MPLRSCASCFFQDERERLKCVPARRANAVFALGEGGDTATVSNHHLQVHYNHFTLLFSLTRNHRCVKDCAITTTSTTCGGVITDSSTQLYTDAAACCSSQLLHLDPLLCETRSESGEGEYEGTFRLYPDVATGSCVLDHNPGFTNVCGIGYTCQLLNSSSDISKLYHVSPAGVADCCQDPALGRSNNPQYCKSATMGVVTRMWFVDYSNLLCRQDCEEDPNTPSCTRNTDPTSSYNASPEACCKSKLGYANQAKCLSDSIANPNLPPYSGSDDYYVDYSTSKCVQDCPLGNGGDCGGIVGDSSTKLYRDAKRCCRNTLPYMNLELCRDRSDWEATGTGKFYVGATADARMICIKDISELSCPSGETCQRAMGYLSSLYSTTASCCQSDDAMSELDIEQCQAVSNNVASDKWFRHEDSPSRCAKHCTADSNSAECSIPTNSLAAWYNTVEECCNASTTNSNNGISNLNICVELSMDGGVMLNDLQASDEYYIDWIHQKCVKNCEPLHAIHSNEYEYGDRINCGGIAVGAWVKMFSDVEACCDEMHYVDRNECVNGAT